MTAYSPSWNLRPHPMQKQPLPFLHAVPSTAPNCCTLPPASFSCFYISSPPHKHEGQSLQPDWAYSCPTARRHDLYTPNAPHHVAILCGSLDCRSLPVCPHGTHTSPGYKWLWKKRAKGWHLRKRKLGRERGHFLVVDFHPRKGDKSCREERDESIWSLEGEVICCRRKGREWPLLD